MKYITKQLKRIFDFAPFLERFSIFRLNATLLKTPVTNINNQNTNPVTKRITKRFANKFNWKITLDRIAQTEDIKYWAEELNRIDYWSTREFYDIVLELFVDYEEKPKNWNVPEELQLRIKKTSISIKRKRQNRYIAALVGLGREITIYIAEVDHLTEKEKYSTLCQLLDVLQKFEFRLGKLGKEIFENYDLEFLQKLIASLNPNNKYTEKVKQFTDNISSDIKLIKKIVTRDKNKRLDNKKKVVSFDSLFVKPKIITFLIAYLKTEEGERFVGKNGYWIKSKAELMGFVDALISESYLHNHYSLSAIGRVFSEYFNLSISEKSWTDYNNFKRKDAFTNFINHLKDFELFHTSNS